jgi:predicted kinase
MLGELAATLVHFHAAAETSDRLRRIGGYAGMARNWRDNLTQIAPLAGKVFSQSRYDRIAAAVEATLKRERPLFERREAEGRVRDGHGDLRADAVYFDPDAPGGLCIVDCIEFDERFRVADTGLDLAFLAMDLEAKGYRDFADLLCGLYVAASGDSTLPLVLEFYKAYRAVIRGKVRGILMGQKEVSRSQRATARREAADRFRLAETCLRRKAPRTVVLVMGASGTGKSRIAGPLAVRLGAAYLSTDVTRKQLAGIEPWQPAAAAPDTGLYQATTSERVYATIAERAAAFLDDGRAVVIDGTYLSKERRAPIEALARRTRARLLVVDCQAPEGVIKERQERRRGQAWTTSDGTWQIYLAQRKTYEPPDELPSARRLTLDSTMPTPAAVAAILKKLGVRA